jgi:hypothetical protein
MEIFTAVQVYEFTKQDLCLQFEAHHCLLAVRTAQLIYALLI